MSQALTDEYRVFYNANIAAGIDVASAIQKAHTDVITRAQNDVTTIIPAYDPAIYTDDVSECLYAQFYDFAAFE